MSCLRGVLASQRSGELLGDRLDIGKVERSRESRRGPHTHDRNIGSIHRLLEGVARVIEKFGRLDRHDLTPFVQHRRDGGDGLPRLEDPDDREARIPKIGEGAPLPEGLMLALSKRNLAGVFRWSRSRTVRRLWMLPPRC
jgi:hypothetical protein